MKLMNWLKKTTWYIKLMIVVAVAAASYFGYTKLSTSTPTVSYQTAKVSKGTLVSSLAASGAITSGNTTNISTKASGTVTKVYVKNGDTVKKGQKILDMTLDSDGVKNRSLAWQAYLKAKENVVSTTKDKQDMSIQIWKDKQAILDAQTAQDNKNIHIADYTDAEKNQIDEAVSQAKLAFDVDASKFENSDANITAAKIAMDASYLDYQNVSGAIVAPVAGIINNLTLTAGSTLTASTSQSTSTGSTYASSQNIGFIRSSNNQYQAKVSLTEVDAPKVQAGQKVNIAMDAHSDKAFTGKVLAVDVSGTSASGVSSYPAIILMDPTELPIYPNMTVSATIITDIQDNVLLVPTTAVTTSNGESSVEVMKNGIPSPTSVVIGASNDTQTIIVNGLSEGDTIVTGSSTSVKNSNTTSAFSNTSSTNGGGAPAIFRGPGQ